MQIKERITKRTNKYTNISYTVGAKLVVIARVTSTVVHILLKQIKFIDLTEITIIYVDAVVYVSLYIMTDNC